MEKYIQLAMLFADASTMYDKHAAAAFKARQLPPVQGRILLILWLGGGLKMKAIADHLDLDAPNVTAIVDKLEAQGLIERQNDIHDRRVKTLVFTQKGKITAGALVQEIADLPALKRLTEKEVNQLIALFLKLVRNDQE